MKVQLGSCPVVELDDAKSHKAQVKQALLVTSGEASTSKLVTSGGASTASHLCLSYRLTVRDLLEEGAFLGLMKQ